MQCSFNVTNTTWHHYYLCFGILRAVDDWTARFIFIIHKKWINMKLLDIQYTYVATILTPCGQHFEGHDSTLYNQSHILTRCVITRQTIFSVLIMLTFLWNVTFVH